MNIKRLIGLDNLAADYAYARDPETGYTSARRVAEKWVPTTCGYCSVGCGLEIGVRDDRAVAVRPLESHPVNRGKLCPKGLSEHHTIHFAPETPVAPTNSGPSSSAVAKNSATV